LELLLQFLALFVGRSDLLCQASNLLRLFLALRGGLLLSGLQRGDLRVELLDLLVSLDEYFTHAVDLFLQPSALISAILELLLQLVLDLLGSRLLLLLVLEHRLERLD
jgi:hypothetical protein